MKNLNKILALLLTLALAATLFGCKSDPSPAASQVPDAPLRVGALKGPTAVGMVTLMARSDAGEATGSYTFSLHTAPDELAGLFLKGEVDIAALPTNLAASLYNKSKGGLTVLAVNTYGVLHILERGDTVHSIADLAGKTVYATGEGANPEYVLRYLLKQNGVADVNPVFLSENDELIARLASGEAAIAMLPEPACSAALAKMPDLRRAVDLTKAWEEVTPSSSLLMGCVAVRKEVLESQPEKVSLFLAEYAASVDAVKNTDVTAGFCEQYGILPTAALAASAIPYCHIAYLSGSSMQHRLADYLTVLYEADPASIGGKLPEKDFYYYD